MGDWRRFPSRKHSKGRMAAKGVFSLVFVFACVTLATSQQYPPTTKYPPTKYPPTHPTHPTKYPPTPPPTGGYHKTTKYPPTHPTKYPPTPPAHGGYHKTTKYPPTHPTKYPPTTKYPPPPPPPHGGYHKSLCQCINPFHGKPNAYRGDPDTLCGPQGPGVCYVDCNADCRDIQPTASASRCKSSLACDIIKGAEWQ